MLGQRHITADPPLLSQQTQNICTYKQWTRTYNNVMRILNKYFVFTGMSGLDFTN